MCEIPLPPRGFILGGLKYHVQRQKGNAKTERNAIKESIQKFPGTHRHKSCSRKSMRKLDLSVYAGSQCELNKRECEGGFVFVFWMVFCSILCCTHETCRDSDYATGRTCKNFNRWDYSSQKFQTIQAALGSYWHRERTQVILDNFVLGLKRKKITKKTLNTGPSLFAVLTIFIFLFHKSKQISVIPS